MTSYMNESYAIAKYVRVSASKSRRVLKQIQGKNCHEARLILEFMPYKSARTIIKILESALSNLKQKQNNSIENKKIIITSAFANKGPTLKRFQPRAQGRAFPIKKQTCHIHINIKK
uniref:Large ribosomal subunit protein uL22c n=1 Tax=Osmundea sinicola TaxID=290685 RepID=A0A7L4WPS2_9FLOR|nr:ribosomal protein L22 [Osmundea sinicola]QFR99928.1 ribosomal protein L22 [Osmundea sinicola]